MSRSARFTPVFRASLVPAVTLAVILGTGQFASPGVNEWAVSVAVAAAGVYLLSRVSLRETPHPWPLIPTCLGAVLMTLGAVSQSWLVLSLGWTTLTYASVSRYLDETASAQVRPWWPVVFLVVPWVWAEGWWLGYAIRSTGAAASEWVLACFFDDVARQGTSVDVAGIRLNVEAACAGLNTLQAFLLVGLAGAAVSFRRFSLTLAAVPIAVLLAWLANTARVIFLGILGATAGAEWATGTTHDVLGWLTLAVAAFVLARLIPDAEPNTTAVTS